MSDELWTRHLGGEELSPTELRQLAEDLARPERREECLDDLELHRSLLHLGPRSRSVVPDRDPTLARRVLPRLVAAAALFALGVWFGRDGDRTVTLPARDDGSSVAVSTGEGAAERSPVEGIADRPLANPVAGAITFASLESDRGRGESDGGPGRRIGTGPLELDADHTRLRFDNGVSLRLYGAVRLTLESATALRLDAGRMGVRVPAELASFTVHTPTARVVDSGTSFELDVLGGGETLVRVSEADLRIEPGRREEWSGRDLRLARGGLSSARITPLVPRQEGSPIVAEAEGPSGDFSALLVARGRYVEVGDPELLERVRTYFSELLAGSPEIFEREWQRYAFRGNAPRVRLAGGGEVELSSIDDVLDARSLVTRSMLVSDPRVAASFVLPVAPRTQAGILQIGDEHWRFQDYDTLSSLLEALRVGYARRFMP